MKNSIICGLTFLICITKSFMLTTDKTGNVTSSQLSNIYNAISQAQNTYQQDQLNSIAKYIYTKLHTIYKSDMWSTYVYSKDVSRVAFVGIADLDKYLWRIKYGKYNFTYVMWRTGTCWKQGAGGAVAEFGQSVNSTLRDKILQTVNNSILYRGDNMEGAAEYISEKLGTAWKGGWTVVISYPTASFGFYQCRLQEFWANLRQFADFKWSYYMSRG